MQRLARRLARLGWQLEGNGFVRDVFGVFSLFDSSWDVVQRRLWWSWPQVIASELNHRPTFEGIQHADLEELHKGLARFSTADQTYLRCNLDGTLFIDQHREKHERSSDRVCSACGQPDSFYHQHWECPETRDCRSSFPWPHLLESLPACLINHGWPVVSHAWLELQRHFESLPDLSINVSGMVLPHTQTLDFFVDGSCQMPKERKFRFASWAITTATSQGSMWENQVVAFGHVVGQHQTSYRGELVAMVKTAQLVCALGRKARIWSDCQSVVRRARVILNGGHVKANSPHSDLWSSFATAVAGLPVGQLLICKVTSHCSLSDAASDLEQWAFWHNHQVDELAGQWNLRRPNFLGSVESSGQPSLFYTGTSLRNL